LEALVDTGSSYTVVPAPVLEALGVERDVTDQFVLADGWRVEMALGRTSIRVEGRTEMTLVVFGGADSRPLLGAYTPEGVILAPVPHDRVQRARLSSVGRPGRPRRVLAAARRRRHQGTDGRAPDRPGPHRRALDGRVRDAALRAPVSRPRAVAGGRGLRLWQR